MLLKLLCYWWQWILDNCFFQVASVDASTTAGPPSHSNHKAVKNLFTIVVLFTICLAPYCVMTIVMCFDPIRFLQNTTLGRIYVGLLVMFLSNSLVNPIVYAVRFRSFTVAFKLMFRLIKEEDRFAAIENAKWIGMTKIPKFQSCTILRLDTSAQQSADVQSTLKSETLWKIIRTYHCILLHLINGLKKG